MKINCLVAEVEKRIQLHLCTQQTNSNVSSISLCHVPS